MSINNETIILIIITIPLLIITFLNIFKDTMNFDILKSKIPNLIKLAKKIEIINFNIKIQHWDNNQIMNKKYILLKYIEELELLQNVWEYFSFNSIINHSDIKCPYILAYNIREILEMPLTKDENNEDYVWLNDKERSFIKLFQSIDFNKDNFEDQELHETHEHDFHKNIEKNYHLKEKDDNEKDNNEKDDNEKDDNEKNDLVIDETCKEKII